MPRKKAEGICSEIDCDKPVKSRGWCKYHYQKFYKFSPDYNPITGDKTKHPLYSLWLQRKSGDMLCDAWLDFGTFVKDVGTKPNGRFLLIRLRDEKFGPDNFKWQEHLKRKPGESRKEWWARKWAARQLQNPSHERGRHFKRKYGITIQQYEEQEKQQDFRCAICGDKETASNASTGTIKRLAVDHCHITNKVRELLCWRCNSVLGKVNDNVELLNKMTSYLIKHR